jgi:hypothetical protein
MRAATSSAPRHQPGMLPMIRTVPWLIVSVTLLGGCALRDSPLEPSAAVRNGTPWLQTDRAEYVLREEGQVLAVDFELVYENRLDQAVAVPTCHSPMRPIVERRVGGEWVHAWSPVELMCITSPLVIPAGGSYRFRYPVRLGMWDLESWPRSSEGGINGTHRLVWFVGAHDRRADNGLGAPLPLEYRVSNEFVLRD